MSMRISVAGIFVTGILLGMSGCAIDARTDYDPRVSLATCHSFAFTDAATRPHEGAAFGNPLNEKRLRDGIASNLTARGLQSAPDIAGADCVVGYAIGTRMGADSYGPHYAWGMGWGGWGGWGYPYMGGAAIWSDPYEYREGRVTVDLYDARSHEALWHAYVNEDVTHLTGADAEERINAVVAAMFAKFPVPAPPAPAASATKS